MQPALEDVIRSEEPDWVLVYGDTNSTLAGARAGRALDVPVAHVEAGLRSGDWSMPEEHNRVETDRLAALLLCPDERSAQTLAHEGVDGRVEVVGDVMLDATLRLAPIARERSGALERFAVEPGRYVLATIHREANVEPDAAPRHRRRPRPARRSRSSSLRIRARARAWTRSRRTSRSRSRSATSTWPRSRRRPG